MKPSKPVNRSYGVYPGLESISEVKKLGAELEKLDKRFKTDTVIQQIISKAEYAIGSAAICRYARALEGYDDVFHQVEAADYKGFHESKKGKMTDYPDLQKVTEVLFKAIAAVLDTKCKP